MNWYLLVLKKYAVFSGRARRKEYWLFMAFNLAIPFLLGRHFLGQITGIGNLFCAIYQIGTLIPCFAVTARRLHDTGMSGWLQLVFWIPYVSLTACLFSGDSGIVLETSGASLLVGAIGMLFWLVRPGARGANRFGADPKDAAAQL